MANVFADDAMRQKFQDGVQDDLRPLLPMAEVSEVMTEDMHTFHARYGDDFAADNSTNSTTGSVHDVTYLDDTIRPDNEANKRTRTSNQEIVDSARGSSGGWDLVMNLKDRHAHGLAEAIHRNTYRKTVDGAGLVVDAGVLAGGASNGTPITLSASNPDDIASKVYSLMVDAGVPQYGSPYFMIDGVGGGFFKLYGMGSGFASADRQLGDGWKITTDFGFDFYQSAEVEREQVLTFSGNLVADNTVTFTAGRNAHGLVTITLTAKATPATEGQVDVGADTETSIANLAAAINGTGTPSATTYIELSAAHRKAIKDAGIVATATATTLTISSFRSIAGAGTITNGTWGTESKKYLVGLRGATKLILPRSGYNLVEDEAPVNTDGTRYLGMELISSQIHNAGVLTKDKYKIAVVSVAA